MRFTVFLPLTMPTLLSAFTAHWNFFDKACLNWYKDFDRFDIEANKGLEFWGEKISIFYEFNFGSYPYYRNYDENEPVNGGHPQLCNLTAHLEVVKLNITKRIKDENFAGLAVIDFEHWRPLFDENGYQKMQVYQNVSIKIATEKYPHFTHDQIKEEAKKEYNEAAKEFFLKTIEEARILRPNGKWGFYGFPYCDYDAGTSKKPSCTKTYQDWNNRMMFLFEASDALYPSIYLENKNTPEERSKYVKAILEEALRIANMFSPPLPIYAYTKIEYDSRTKIGNFYNAEDLCSTTKQPADLGVDGIIFWGSSNNIKQRCPFIEKEMDGTVGPCITSQSYVVDPADYKCDCDYGYSGDDCSKKDETITSSK
ncbi:hypothetical protein RB195_020732 [Necator americanus]|uniref:Hyaluronidase n=1 Tax=Necator americanus TaxID=51031 RepID=A0ABR1CK94_NECAM